jgi:cell division transport system permease protein
VLGFVVGEAARDVVRGGRVAASAVLLITLSMASLGAFWVLSTNLGQAVARWREQLRIVVYLREEPPSLEREALTGRVQSLPGVAHVRYVSKADALEVVRRELGDQAAIVDTLPANPLPASLEVTPAVDAATPQATRILIERLGTLPEVEEVQGGTVVVERLAQLQRLLQLIGLGVGGLLGLAAVLTVTTATTLVLHARREELEIMRLVGASETVIRLPLLLQGIGQGLLGAALALAALVTAYRLARPQLGPLVTLTLGLPDMAFLSLGGAGALLAGGALLGGLGGWLARGRV